MRPIARIMNPQAAMIAQVLLLLKSMTIALTVAARASFSRQLSHRLNRCHHSRFTVYLT
jgi:hypothetical protein